MATACAVHCAALPLAAGLLSAIGLGALLDERIEVALLMLAGLLGGWSLWPAFRRRHRRTLPLLLFGSGYLVLIAVRRFEDAPGALEIPMILVGVGAVASAHLLNPSLCRHCHECDKNRSVEAAAPETSAGPRRRSSMIVARRAADRDHPLTLRWWMLLLR